MTHGEERIAFYHELGSTLTQWVLIENDLYNIVLRCFDKENTRLLAIGFFSIDNFRAKLKFVDKLFSEKFAANKQLIKDWETLQKRHHQEAEIA